MDLKDLQICNLSMELGQRIWIIVEKWSHFERNTIGVQIVRSADSIAANISEGFGRYHYKEKKNFGYYARGSLYETFTWLEKSMDRKLVEKQQFDELSQLVKNLGVKLNNYIAAIGKKPQPNDNRNSTEIQPNDNRVSIE